MGTDALLDGMIRCFFPAVLVGWARREDHAQGLAARGGGWRRIRDFELVRA